jgi:hypothetical protein
MRIKSKWFAILCICFPHSYFILYVGLCWFCSRKECGFGVGVSYGAVRTVVIPMVHDSIIVSNFGASCVFGGPSNILSGIMFSSYNVHVTSTY